MKRSENSDLGIPRGLEMTDEDVHEAMKEIQGYLDITAADFREDISTCLPPCNESHQSLVHGP